jgi:hypothetical protein
MLTNWDEECQWDQQDEEFSGINKRLKVIIFPVGIFNSVIALFASQKVLF